MSTTRLCWSGCGSSIPTIYTRKAASARTQRKSFLTIESSSPNSSRTKLTGELLLGNPEQTHQRDKLHAPTPQWSPPRGPIRSLRGEQRGTKSGPPGKAAPSTPDQDSGGEGQPGNSGLPHSPLYLSPACPLCQP